MAAKKRKIINRRQLKVAEIWERNPNETQQNIADILCEEFGISVTQQTISNDLKALDKRVQAESIEVIKSVRDNLLKEYEYIYGEAIAAWLKSLTDKEIKVFESTEGGLEQKLKAVERTEGQSGNPALLGQAQAALKAIRDMFGVDAPEKKDIKLDDTGLTDQDRANRIIELLDRARERRDKPAT